MERVDLDNLKALYDAATPGEWLDTDNEIFMDRAYAIHVRGATSKEQDYADATFIAALHNAFPALCEELTAARKVCESTEKLLHAFEVFGEINNHPSNIAKINELHELYLAWFRSKLAKCEEKEG